MTPSSATTVIVFRCQCTVRVVGSDNTCAMCGRPVTPTKLVEAREVRTFDAVRSGPPPVPPWARVKSQRVTRPGRR